MIRSSAYLSGNTNVEVLADRSGIAVSLANTNEMTFNIPSGNRIISAKIRLTSGFSSLKVFMGTADMLNASSADRWMPIVQAWREDTGAQLTGITTTMDLSNFNKFTINGLVNTANIHIRIVF
jgi:hypothetical protein